MHQRFHAPDLQAASTRVALPADEAEHLTRVLRLGVGADIRVFDGRGLEREARVVAASRRAVEVQVGAAVVPAPEPRVRITLAHAVLKGDKTDTVFRDATTLGVAAFRPLLTARTDVPAAAFSSSRRVERWGRIVAASVKQCGRAVLPDVAAPEPIETYLARDRPSMRLMFVEPGGPDGREAPLTGEALRALGVPSDVHVLVGPEGGWAPDELELARDAGCLAVTLGRRVWRADVAPTIALGVLQFLWGDL